MFSTSLSPFALSPFALSPFAMIFRFFSLGLLAGLFCSCESVSNIAELSKSKYEQLRRPTPPIVEVKKESLQKEKEKKGEAQPVLAYNSVAKKDPKARKAPAVGEFFAPDDFDAGALPTSSNFPTLGLLPPLKPGGSSSIETEESMELTTDPKAPEEEVTEEAPAMFSSQ